MLLFWFFGLGVDSDKTEKTFAECRVLKDDKLEPNQACDIYDVKCNPSSFPDQIKFREIYS